MPSLNILLNLIYIMLYIHAFLVNKMLKDLKLEPESLDQMPKCQALQLLPSPRFQLFLPLLLPFKARMPQNARR